MKIIKLFGEQRIAIKFGGNTTTIYQKLAAVFRDNSLTCSRVSPIREGRESQKDDAPDRARS